MWMCMVVWCFFTAVQTISCKEDESRVVRIDSGFVQGYKDPNEDIFVFYGIPYATVPKGPKRFTAPLPAPKWLETLEAVDKGVICPQGTAPFLQLDTKTIQEDCLIANVYVPKSNESNLPVMVYIHGGGFVIGFGDMVKPKKLVSSKKVIVVTFNYRLGAHGFLCLGTEDAPGNAGMKDQVALLRWVKKNIASFGGNPKDVTIAGFSAGSSSVDLLILSKMGKGLFNKVIPESGANISPYSVQIDPIKNAKEYAALLQYNGGNDIYELEDFFKNVSYEVLQSADVGHRTDSIFVMEPCVERNLGEERFLEDSPINILRSGDFEKLPMLYGFANMEGLMRIDIFDSWKHKMNINFSDFLPNDLLFKDDEEKTLVAHKIKKFYFNDKEVGDDTVLDYINYFSDVLFTCPTLRSIELQLKASNNKIYLYEYSYVDKDTPAVPYTNIRGAGHCAQTDAVSDGSLFSHLNEVDISNEYKNMKKIMRELWLNFISNGKPKSHDVPAWPPVGADSSPYMELKENSELKEFLLKERCLFWQDIYEKYYHSPSPPPPPPPREHET